MPFIAQVLEEFLPGGSGGKGGEGRADAGRGAIVPGAATFSAKEELGVGKSCHAITGGGSVHPNPGPNGLLARQPSVSQPAQPTGRGAGGWMGELQEGDNPRSLASSTLEILRARVKLAEDRGSSARHVRARITVF